jgi:hypothetical protein
MQENPKNLKLLDVHVFVQVPKHLNLMDIELVKKTKSLKQNIYERKYANYIMGWQVVDGI